MNAHKQALLIATNIYKAKIQLPPIVKDIKLLGQPVISAKVVEPQVKPASLDAAMSKRRMSTLKSSIRVPDNFYQAFDSEIAEKFNENN